MTWWFILCFLAGFVVAFILISHVIRKAIAKGLNL